MDKFGIFKLLGSFMDIYNKSKKNDGSAEIKNTNSAAENIFSSLFNAGQKTDPIKKERVPDPLQSGMLATMRSHDEFVRRVKENAKHR